MAITVLNAKHVRGRGVAGEYIGRWHPEFKKESPLRNEWSHVKGAKALHQVGSRDEAVACYRRWLWDVIKSARGPAYEELLRLAAAAKRGPLNLICWCAPESCHGHVLASAIEYLNRDAR